MKTITCMSGRDTAKHLEFSDQFVHDAVEVKILKRMPSDSIHKVADLLTKRMPKAFVFNLAE
jgi:hypothetical protein